MTSTLIITIVIEGAAVVGYCLWRQKPVAPILLTGVFANLLTQSFLWVFLNLFYRQYLAILIVAEILIVVIEGLLLYSVPVNRLRFTESIFLSLGLNVASFSVGWFLPL